MRSIALIAKYFGKPADFLRLWFLTAKNNPTIDFIFLTDDESQYSEFPHCPNVRLFKISEEEFAKRALNACPGVKSINLKKFGYHCNQFRPMFGVMFADLLNGYDFWGYVDTDVVFGDVRGLLPDSLLDKYDKLFERGHFTLFRNSVEVNKRYLLSNKHCRISYRQICRTSLNYGFDEMHGINRIYERERFPFYSNFDLVLDCLLFRHEFSPSQKANSFFGRSVYVDYREGKLYCIDAYTGKEKEILCAHFQKRLISLPEHITGGRFVIVPDKMLLIDNAIPIEALAQARQTTPKPVVFYRVMIKKLKSIPRYFGLIFLFVSKHKELKQ